MFISSIQTPVVALVLRRKQLENLPRMFYLNRCNRLETLQSGNLILLKNHLMSMVWICFDFPTLMFNFNLLSIIDINPKNIMRISICVIVCWIITLYFYFNFKNRIWKGQKPMSNNYAKSIMSGFLNPYLDKHFSEVIHDVWRYFRIVTYITIVAFIIRLFYNRHRWRVE